MQIVVDRFFIRLRSNIFMLVSRLKIGLLPMTYGTVRICIHSSKYSQDNIILYILPVDDLCFRVEGELHSRVMVGTDTFVFFSHDVIKWKHFSFDVLFDLLLNKWFG